MPTESEKIPYIELLKKEYLKTVARKSEVEANFKIELSEEYTALKKKMLSQVIELVKLGVKPQVKPEKVVVSIDDIEYEFPKKVFKDEMGAREYEVVFDDYEYVFDDGEIEDDKKSSEKGNNQHTENGSPFMNYFNPFFSYNPTQMPFMPFPVFGNFGLPDNKKEGEKALAATEEMSKELSSIRERLEALEKQPEDNINLDEYNMLKAEYDTLKAKYDKLNALYENADKEREFLSLKVTDITKRLDDALDSNKLLEKQVERAKKDIESARDDSYATAYANIEKEMTNLENENNKLHNDIDKLRQELKTCRNELNNAREERNKVNESLNNINNKKQEEIESAIKEALDRERVVYNDKFKEYEKTIDDLRAQLEAPREEEDYSQTIRDMTIELNNVKIERDSLRKNVETLTNENEQLQKDKNKRIDEVKTLETKVEELSDVAFFDSKTRAKSNVAFNSEFNGFDKNNLILAVVGIRGMKDINDQWGRASGDRVISTVADELINAFPNGHIYRVMGDQFIVVQEGVTLNFIQGQLADATRKLALDDIVIAYGTAVGNSCSDYSDIIDVAESNLIRMKNMPTINDTENNIYQSARQAASPIAPKVTKKKNVDVPQEINLEEDILKFMEENA